MSEELKSEQELVVLPIEEQISQELVKANVTEAVIGKLKEKYLPLKIAGTEDKETYLLVKEGRKECKSIRVMASKICKKGRENAVAIQKAWVGKEKEVTDQIAEVEDYLESQEKEYEAGIAAEKDARKRKQEEQLILRQQKLTAMGALYSDGNFVLGDVSFEFSAIKESEEDIWNETIYPRFHEEYLKIQADELLKEHQRKEAEAELKRQQEEMERKRKELEEKEAELKLEAERQASEANKAREAKQNARIDQLVALGLKFDFVDHYKGYGCFVPILDIQCHDDEKWNKLIEGVTAQVDRKKAEEAEEKRKEQERRELQNDRYAELFPYREFIGEADMNTLWSLTAGSYSILLVGSKKAWADAEEEKGRKIAEEATIKERERIEEEQRQAELKRKYELRKARISMLSEHDLKYPGDFEVLGEISEETWMKDFNELKASRDEIIRKQEEERKADELAKSGDKIKWEQIVHNINTLYTSIENLPMRSSQYRKKAAILREKLEEIKAL